MLGDNMKSERASYRNKTIYQVLKYIGKYVSINSIEGTGVHGFILRISEITDPELKETLKANGIKVGDFVRLDANGYSRCGKSFDLAALQSTYSGYSGEIKAIINASQDFDFSKEATSSTWSTYAMSTRTMLNSLTELGFAVGGGSPTSVRNVANNNDMITVIIAVSSISALCILGFFLFKKKKQEQ